MSRETIEAPTDAQLQYIKTLCLDRGLERPEAVFSKGHASEIIAAMLDGTYRPEDHRVTAERERYDRTPMDAEAEAASERWWDGFYEYELPDA